MDQVALVAAGGEGERQQDQSGEARGESEGGVHAASIVPRRRDCQTTAGLLAQARPDAKQRLRQFERMLRIELISEPRISVPEALERYWERW